jgi:hypothetical protein
VACCNLLQWLPVADPPICRETFYDRTCRIHWNLGIHSMVRDLGFLGLLMCDMSCSEAKRMIGCTSPKSRSSSRDIS